jgi:hypothetical protein
MRTYIYIYICIYRGVYHDDESGTLVQLVFAERKNGITLDDVASSVCTKQKGGERKQKELEDKGRRERKK